jgi:hypothetical protein
MRYFTFEWATGNESGVDPLEEYSRFLSSLDQSGSVHQFASTESLNDALVDRVVYDSNFKELKLLLLTGDLQRGYWRTELSYTDAVLHGEAVLINAMDCRPTEIWFGEFARQGERLVHNFLLAPKDLRHASAREFSIEFGSFNYTQEAAT